jgi:isoprenylcysteine carboxyl methyltransferase (ICMT) family protein YpbQ
VGYRKYGPVMNFCRWRRLLTNIFLVLLLLVLARLAQLLGDNSASAALVIVALMSLQTLAFAESNQGRGVVSPPRLRRVLFVRAVGLAAISLLVVGSYELQRISILNDWHIRRNLLWLLGPLCFSFLIDTLSARPYSDEYWTLGKILTASRWKLTFIAKRDFGSSFVKVFFYPMMFVYIEQYLDLFTQYWLPKSWTAAGIYYALTIYYLLVDLTFGASGYALSLKILGNRVSSVNPYPVGWVVTIICYSPFWDMLGLFAIFQWHPDWINWTNDWPVVQIAWLAMIASSFIIYAWSTVELGIRFSNLTYRGTVSSGPYRLMKHPAYVSKVLSYLLITVPFVPLHGSAFAFEQCLALSLFCLIYYCRAKYEEKHLLQYAEYRVYASSTILRFPKVYYNRVMSHALRRRLAR